MSARFSSGDRRRARGFCPLEDVRGLAFAGFRLIGPPPRPVRRYGRGCPREAAFSLSPGPLLSSLPWNAKESEPFSARPGTAGGGPTNKQRPRAGFLPARGFCFWVERDAAAAAVQRFPPVVKELDSSLRFFPGAPNPACGKARRGREGCAFAHGAPACPEGARPGSGARPYLWDTASGCPRRKAFTGGAQLCGRDGIGFLRGKPSPGARGSAGFLPGGKAGDGAARLAGRPPAGQEGQGWGMRRPFARGGSRAETLPHAQRRAPPFLPAEARGCQPPP